MREEVYKLKGYDGVSLHVYKWIPENADIKGIVQIAHGMAEHGARYKYFAEKLCDNGYIVYANDHRGHGKTAEKTEELGYLGQGDGFSSMVQDLYEVNKFITKDKGEVPLILFGHSMGSFISQRYIQLYGNTVDKVVLCGSNGPINFMADIGILISGLEMKVKGPKAKSPLMDKLSFGNYNNHFKPTRTPSDWLSSDEKEVQKYIDDPYCGFICTTSFYHSLLKGLKVRQKKENINKVPKDLPILLISGSEDPVGEFSEGVKRLYNLYVQAGIKNIEINLYEKGRHEILNEVNKDEVIEDIITWLHS